MLTIQQGKAPGMVHRTTAGRWFKRVVWIGIVTNVALALPTIAAPSMMLELAGLPPAAPDLWPRFAGLLLTLVSLAYVPAAIDPDRHRISAWFTLVCRLAGVLFFSIQPDLSAARLARPRVPDPAGRPLDPGRSD